MNQVSDASGPGVYLLWWASDHWRSRDAPANNWCQMMYIGSAGDLTKRYKQHQRGSGNTYMWSLWDTDGPPCVFWFPSSNRDTAYLLERAAADCAVVEHDWGLWQSLSNRWTTAPRVLINDKRPACSVPEASLALSEAEWHSLTLISETLSELGDIPVVPGASSRHREAWMRSAHDLADRRAPAASFLP